MFTDLGELLEHKRNYCKLRFTCKCHTFNGTAPSTYSSEKFGRKASYSANRSLGPIEWPFRLKRVSWNSSTTLLSVFKKFLSTKRPAFSLEFGNDHDSENTASMLLSFFVSCIPFLVHAIVVWTRCKNEIRTGPRIVHRSFRGRWTAFWHFIGLDPAALPRELARWFV